MTIDEYMTANNLTDAALGKSIGKSRVTMSRYRRGLEPIPGAVVKHLVELSKGQMTANELLGIDEETLARADEWAGAAE